MEVFSTAYQTITTVTLAVMDRRTVLLTTTVTMTVVAIMKT